MVDVFVQPLVAVHPSEMRLPNAPDYPGLEYPPVFEPGTYSLSDVSTLLRNRRMRTFDNADDPMTRHNENYLSLENGDPTSELRAGDSENNNEVVERDENENSDGDDGFIFYGQSAHRPV